MVYEYKYGTVRTFYVTFYRWLQEHDKPLNYSASGSVEQTMAPYFFR